MAVFRMKIMGRRAPLLVKADGLTEAKARVITECKSLTADEMEAALTDGETVWRPGDDFPADTPEEEPEDPDRVDASET